MTPYELIEELEERHLQGCIYQDAANMLRGQADKIAELEKQKQILIDAVKGWADDAQGLELNEEYFERLLK
jgi:hypothetical protein